MSSSPNALAPAGNSPTGLVFPLPAYTRLARSGAQSSPHGYVRRSSPRAARTHSSSVGSRTAAPRSAASASHNANVCSAPTVAGWSGPASSTGTIEVSGASARTCATVSRVRMTRNAGTFTVRRGTSFSSQAGSTPARSDAASSARTVPRSDPITTSPAGTSTRLSSIRASALATSMPNSLFRGDAGPPGPACRRAWQLRRPAGHRSLVGVRPTTSGLRPVGAHGRGYVPAVPTGRHARVGHLCPERLVSVWTQCPAELA